MSLFLLTSFSLFFKVLDLNKAGAKLWICRSSDTSTHKVRWRRAKEDRTLAEKCMRKGCFNQVSLATCLVPLGPGQKGIPIQITGYFYWNRGGFLELDDFSHYHSRVKIYIALNCWGGKRRNFRSVLGLLEMSCNGKYLLESNFATSPSPSGRLEFFILSVQ